MPIPNCQKITIGCSSVKIKNFIVSYYDTLAEANSVCRSEAFVDTLLDAALCTDEFGSKLIINLFNEKNFGGVLSEFCSHMGDCAYVLRANEIGLEIVKMIKILSRDYGTNIDSEKSEEIREYLKKIKLHLEFAEFAQAFGAISSEELLNDLTDVRFSSERILRDSTSRNALFEIFICNWAELQTYRYTYNVLAIISSSLKFGFEPKTYLFLSNKIKQYFNEQ